MKTRNLILLAAIAAGCSTKNQNSALVITKVVPPTASQSASTPPTTVCKLDPSADELTFLPINPSENVGNVGVIVTNNMIDTSAINSVLRTNSATFLPHQAVVDYEIAGGTGTAPSRLIVPVSGLEVPTGASASVGVIMFPQGVLSPSLAAGTFIRAIFHIEGKLLDGSTVHTSEREYLFQICTTPGCAQNVCL